MMSWSQIVTSWRRLDGRPTLPDGFAAKVREALELSDPTSHDLDAGTRVADGEPTAPADPSPPSEPLNPLSHA